MHGSKRRSLENPRPPRRWALLAVIAAMLIGLTATVSWAGTSATSFPDWLEPRGLSVVELVGQIPESYLKDIIISYGDGSGIVVYESGSRTEDTVVINTTIYPRVRMASWMPNGKLMVFGCLGQWPIFDHMGTVVPTSTLRIYDSTGTQVTSRISLMYLNYMNAHKPFAHSLQYERYPVTTYGTQADQPLPLGPEGLTIPPNSGCRIEIFGEDIYPLKGVFTLKVPPSVDVRILAKEEFKVRSYIGPGNVGIFTPLMTQLEAEYGERHRGIVLDIPAKADYVLMNFPPMPGDPYMDQNGGPPYPNADRPVGGTYRLVLDAGNPGSDLIFSAAFPLQMAWKDADLSEGRITLEELIRPTYLSSPEYVIPAGIPYNPCFTQGNCPKSVLEQIYTTGMPLDIYYLSVRRRGDAGQWVPVQMAGPAYLPAALGNAQGVPTPSFPSEGAVLTEDPGLGISSITLDGAPEDLLQNASTAVTMTKAITPETDVPYRSIVTFTIVASNPAEDNATGVVITDSLPADTTFEQWITRPAGAEETGDEIRWSGTVTAHDSVTFTFTASQTAGYGQKVTNSAEYSHTTGQGTAQAAFTVEPSPTMEIQKEATPSANVGFHSPVTYTITLSNTSNTGATGITLIDKLPDDTTFAEWVQMPAGAMAASNAITWTGEVPAQGAVVFVFVISQTASHGATVTNLVQYSHALGQGTAEADFIVEQGPNLSISKVVVPEDNVEYGNPVIYTVVVNNTGALDATTVGVTDTLPDETSFAGWVQQPTGAESKNGEITWTGTVPAGKAITLTYIANQQAQRGSRLTNTAQYTHASSQGSAQATFTVELETKWRSYLPVVLREADEPWEPLPDGCPCGWFDNMGRMLDFALGY